MKGHRFVVRSISTVLLLLAGCAAQKPATSPPRNVLSSQVWGSKGGGAGQLLEPRGITVSRDNRFVYVTDNSGRIQQWTANGKFVRGWLTPKTPTGLLEGSEGLTMLRNGNIAFAHTHAAHILIYSPEGKLLRQFGSYGTQRGQFLLVTGNFEDAQGFLYLADYGGAFDRVSKWTPDGKLVAQWGTHGEKPGEFRRPCGLAIARDANGRETDLLVADVNNHRIQRLDRNTGKVKGIFGGPGHAPGQLDYPFAVAVDKAGFIYTAEFGGHRVQKWSRDGKPLAVWGKAGRRVGELANPRGLAVGPDGSIYVSDTMNHRVQKFHF
jgi:DNA-binding beta-propeller fold protein YncE